MKLNIKKPIIVSALILGGISLSTIDLNAQRFAVKPYADIGVGSAMSLKSDIPFSTKKSSSTAFGVDFGYTFWEKGGNRLEANIGLGYTMASLKLGVNSLEYSYNAPASADEDGNPYVRYYTLSDMEQKFNLGYFNIPLYLTYGYRFSQRIGVHADLGFRFGFKCTAKMNSVRGMASSHGVYPEYVDLVIDAPWLNGFGETNLSESKKGEIEANGFNASLLLGATLDVYIAGPVWLNVGVRYDCGFTNSFKKTFDGGAYTANTAPVTYTVAEGQVVSPLAGYLTSSKLSPFSIHIGLTICF